MQNPQLLCAFSLSESVFSFVLRLYVSISIRKRPSLRHFTFSTLFPAKKAAVGCVFLPNAPAAPLK